MTNRLGLSAALAVLLACASPAAMAANDNPNRNTATESIRSDQVRATKMIGSAVYDRNNVKIGSVTDLILDRDSRIDKVAINVGGFLGMGAKTVAVPPGDLKTDHNRLTLDVTKDQLRQMADYNLANKNTGAGTTQSPVHGGHLGGSGSSVPHHR